MERRSKAIIRRRARTTLDRLTEEIQDLEGRGARILFGIGQRLFIAQPIVPERATLEVP